MPDNDSETNDVTITHEPPKEQDNTINNIVFNYSDIVMTEAMLKLLNRGLNFSILPFKLDITQTLVEYRKFERAIIWYEFFFGNETDSDIKEHIFRTEKTNMPKNYNSPEGLKIFLSSIKS